MTTTILFALMLKCPLFCPCASASDCDADQVCGDLRLCSPACTSDQECPGKSVCPDHLGYCGIPCWKDQHCGLATDAVCGDSGFCEGPVPPT